MDGRRMTGLEVDLWPPIARITSLFDQKIEKIWFKRPDMDGWCSGLSYEILWFEKAQKKIRVKALPYPARFGFELRGCLTKGAEKEKICANYEIVWCELRDFLTAITRLFDSEKQDFA